MALAPTGRRYAHDAPPSPIPTARGSRSAANHSFIQFLETSIRLPRLSLPPSHFLSSTTQPLHSDVDFRSLMIGDDYCDSVSRILSSSEKFGAFRIINHGVSLDRLTSLLNETENVFNDKVLGPNFVKSYEDREEILWFRSRTQRMRLTDESYRNFRQNMDYVGNKLEAIADRINGVILESLDEKIQAEIKERESTLIICRYYSHYRCRRVNGRIGKEKEEDDALSLHLPLQRCEFHAQSDGNSLHFNADADVVIVAIGNQLPEWSMGNLKSAAVEVSEPDLHGTQASGCTLIKLKISVTRLKTISMTEQILFSFMIYLFYEIFASNKFFV